MRTFAQLLESFLVEYAPRRRCLSDNTLRSYRDTFVLLLRWLSEEAGRLPDSISVEDLGRRRIEAFCLWLSSARDAGPSTVNARLSAIRSFAAYAASVEPACLAWSESIREIRPSKAPRKEIGFLSPEAVGAIVAAAEGSIRDHALLSILYDSGARVSEISSARRADLRADRPASIKLLGKGSKARVVPLCSQAACIGRRYLSEVPGGPDDPLFRNRDGDPVGRAGISWLLSKYASMAHRAHPDTVPAKVHPHMLRHSKAMHLLESGVNIVYIRDFLGHSSVTTTEVYARASLKAKREAIERAAANALPESAYTAEAKSELLEWLKSLL